jgi:hypothetical protein
MLPFYTVPRALPQQSFLRSRGATSSPAFKVSKPEASRLVLAGRGLGGIRRLGSRLS